MLYQILRMVGKSEAAAAAATLEEAPEAENEKKDEERKEESADEDKEKWMVTQSINQSIIYFPKQPLRIF